MSYTKTTWVQNNPPYINATNLNKMEQGVADSQSVPTISALGSVTGVSDGGLLRVQGYYSAGDGGGGLFRRHATASDTADSGTVFTSADGGRWKRIIEGPINVKWFGARGDYAKVSNPTSNDTAAFRAWATFITTQTINLSEFPDEASDMGVHAGHIPRGQYRITEEDAFMLTPAARTQGLTLSGDGEKLTRVFFDPPTVTGDMYLWRNADLAGDFGGYLTVRVRDMTFDFKSSNSVSFMLSSSEGGVQDYRFDNVTFLRYKYGLRLQGSNNNSEMVFHTCAMHGATTTFLYSETSDQFLNYDFFSTRFEPDYGNLIRFTKGGEVNVYGGSFIMTGAVPSVSAGTFFLIDSTSNFNGVCRFHCEGVRFEMRHANNRIIDSTWDIGTISFDTCDMTSHMDATYASTFTTARFQSTSYDGAMVSWTNCMLIGNHEYQYGSTTYQQHPIATYENVEWRGKVEAKDAIITTAGGGTPNAGGTPVVHFNNCRGETFGPQPRLLIYDTDHNWHLNSHATARRRTVSIKDGSGKNPTASGSVGIRLPLNAVITRVIFNAPAFGTSTQTGWSFTLRTTDGTPVTIDSIAPGTQLQLGFDRDTSMRFRCNTDARRNIDLVANASVDQSTNQFLCLVEYIG